MNLETLKRQPFNLELLITEQCNFSCEHCMYDSGPHRPKTWMSDEILDKVKIQVDYLKNCGIMPIVNIIGGEPTINFAKFQHILDKIHEWEVSITISTNGWWLSTDQTIEKFFSIVSRYAGRNGTGWNSPDEWPFVVRISDDPYHEKIRKIKNINHALSEIFKNKEMMKKFNTPLRDEKRPWIYGQPWKNGYYYIAPNGRGKSCENLDYYLEVVGNTFCFHDLDNTMAQNFHYDPEGKTTDMCGFGSIYDFGTVDDNIFFLMQLIEEYKNYRKSSGKEYNCRNCREMVNEWKISHLQKTREKYSYCNR